MSEQPEIEIAPMAESDVESASLFANNNFRDSLAIFYNDEGVEQFHDSVSDMAISERMHQHSNFFLVRSEGRLVGFFELYRIRHIELLLLERGFANERTVARIVEFILDRPFIFVILGRDDLPLFVGIVNDPTA